MKFFTGIALALEALSIFSSVAAEPEIVVDRLVSRRSLEKRGSGHANGGNDKNSGRGKDGKQKNSGNYEMSFYHINDVHACVSPVYLLRRRQPF